MAFRKTALRYLGRISGCGVIKQNGRTIAPARFDFDGYFRPDGGVTGCGEIQAPADVLRELFGRDDLQLLTDQGRLLGLSFWDSALHPASDSAHVDVTGDLPWTVSRAAPGSAPRAHDARRRNFRQ